MCSLAERIILAGMTAHPEIRATLHYLDESGKRNITEIEQEEISTPTPIPEYEDYEDFVKVD